MRRIISDLFQLLTITGECYIFGYGSEEFTGDATLELRIGSIDIITQEECEADLGQYMAPERNSGMFCAIGKSSSGLVDACQVRCQILSQIIPIPFLPQHHLFFNV